MMMRRCAGEGTPRQAPARSGGTRVMSVHANHAQRAFGLADWLSRESPSSAARSMLAMRFGRNNPQRSVAGRPSCANGYERPTPTQKPQAAPRRPMPIRSALTRATEAARARVEPSGLSSRRSSEPLAGPPRLLSASRVSCRLKRSSVLSRVVSSMSTGAISLSALHRPIASPRGVESEGARGRATERARDARHLCALSLC
eukprot:scaffold224384_cov35-Tisochrysis_lutea.AAC.1